MNKLCSFLVVAVFIVAASALSLESLETNQFEVDEIAKPRVLLQMNKPKTEVT